MGNNEGLQSLPDDDECMWSMFSQHHLLQWSYAGCLLTLEDCAYSFDNVKIRSKCNITNHYDQIKANAPHLTSTLLTR